jgi:hypothetical protein
LSAEYEHFSKRRQYKDYKLQCKDYNPSSLELLSENMMIEMTALILQFISNTGCVSICTVCNIIRAFID